MTLKEYIEKAKTDRLLFWRLTSGEIQNLLDEAIEKLESAQQLIALVESGRVNPTDLVIARSYMARESNEA